MEDLEATLFAVDFGPSRIPAAQRKKSKALRNTSYIPSADAKPLTDDEKAERKKALLESMIAPDAVPSVLPASPKETSPSRKKSSSRRVKRDRKKESEGEGSPPPPSSPGTASPELPSSPDSKKKSRGKRSHSKRKKRSRKETGEDADAEENANDSPAEDSPSEPLSPKKRPRSPSFPASSSDALTDTPTLSSSREKKRGLFRRRSKEGSALAVVINHWTAVKQENVDRLAELLESDSELVHQRNDMNSTLLHVACTLQNVALVQLLLDHQSSLEVTDRNGMTPLLIAARHSTPEIVQLLLQAGANVNARDSHQCTPLHWSAQAGEVRITRLLLSADQSVEIDATAKLRSTPLHLAARSGSAEIATLLITCGAAVDALTEQGFSALHMATMRGHGNVVSALITANCNVNQRSKESQTALHLAVIKDQPEIVRLLVDAGCSCNAYDAIRFTPIHWAAKLNRKACADYLLSRGQVNTEAPDQVQRTPLHHAALKGSRDVAQLLLDFGAKFSPMDKFDATPLAYAEKSGNQDVIKLLRKSVKTLQQPHLSSKNIQLLANPQVNDRILLFKGKRKVELARQQWTEMPPAVCSLTELEVLSLAHNLLVSFPSDFTRLHRLQALDISHNRYSELGKAVYRLPHLKKLIAAHNQIFTLPSSFKKLSELESINLCFNRLPEIPPSLCGIHSLQVLRLTDNIIQCVPPDIGKLTQLTELRLCNNRITTVAPEIGQLKNLRILMLRNNEITRLPTSLSRLLILGMFSAEGNPLVYPPPQIMKGTVAEVLGFLRGEDELRPEEEWEKESIINRAGVHLRHHAEGFRKRRHARSRSFETKEAAEIVTSGGEESSEEVSLPAPVVLRNKERSESRAKRRSVPSVSNLDTILRDEEDILPDLDEGVLSPGREDTKSAKKKKKKRRSTGGAKDVATFQPVVEEQPQPATVASPKIVVPRKVVQNGRVMVKGASGHLPSTDELDESKNKEF